MSNWYKSLCTYNIHHSILASLNIKMKLFSALLFVFGVSQAKDENGNFGINDKELTNKTSESINNESDTIS